jgi:hypothetical protein
MNSTQGTQGSNGEYYAYYGYSYPQQTYTPQQQQAAWQMYYQQQAQMAASTGLVPPGMESMSHASGTSTYGASNNAYPYYPYYQQPQPMAYPSKAPVNGSKKAKVPQPPQPKKAKKPAPEPVLCEPCGKTLQSQHDYEMHVKSHVNCPQCSQIMTKKELKIHLAEDHIETANVV